ncbi:cyclic-di-AMP-binding protein CbpB [Helcococcus massiliensis]|uniref:cyclic-di-AMP-binding protein CbpB n=1 Tax=Helcococcus massiliensis TaxID=2040290 RepID=UPI000CDE5DC7|nr:cyclic-di-AMP-binding protein CbpB [Helcococcus massiliensis]
MIEKKISDYFLNNTSSIVTKNNNISMVFYNNSLAHAILVLKESNYMSIPVLNYDKKFIGLISINKIYKSLDLDNFTMEVLETEIVGDHLDTHYAIVREDFDLEEIFKLLINYNFINVVDDNGIYKGMITRSAVLKLTNNLLHNYKDFLD